MRAICCNLHEQVFFWYVRKSISIKYNFANAILSCYFYLIQFRLREEEKKKARAILSYIS